MNPDWPKVSRGFCLHAFYIQHHANYGGCVILRCYSQTGLLLENIC